MSDRPVNRKLYKALKGLDDVNARLREHSQSVTYLNKVSEEISLVEGYKAGNLAIVLDMAPSAKRNDERAVSSDLKRTPRNPFLLVLHDNINDSKMLDHWKKQLMFVANVELVNCPDGIIPSAVWLDVSKDDFKEHGTGDVYLSLPQCRLKILNRFQTGEVGGRCDHARAKLFESSHPSKIQGRSEIVERISCDQGDVLANLKYLREFVFNTPRSRLRIDLDRRCVSVWNLTLDSLQVRDVLVGPFNFQPCVTKQ